MSKQMHERELGLRSSLAQEMSKADFGDVRLSKRLGQIVEALVKEPQKSIPQAMGHEAATEAAYRFLRNEYVSPPAILEPHFRGTVERSLSTTEVAVVHDSSEFRFAGQREGLGRLGASSTTQGFIGHVALAVDAQTDRLPLGLLGLTTLMRPKRKRRKQSWRKRYRAPDKESLRWRAMVDAVELRVGGRVPLVHVMDREADDYTLLSHLVTHNRRFVIRMQYDRRVGAVDGEAVFGWHVQDALELADDVAQRDVQLSVRRLKHAGWHRTSKSHAPRRGRPATLAFRSSRVRLQRPQDGPSQVPPTLEVGLVQVHEVNVPQGETPVVWTLVTTEPVETKEAVLRVVDLYRRRWLVEEYFKVLKTGCAYERRQLESAETLLNALAILAPIAWQMLALRALEEAAPQAPAKEVMRESQLVVLRKMSSRPLSQYPTAREVLYAIAELGGHLKHNGPPGWLTLYRGMEKLLTLEAGYLLAMEKM